MYRMTGILEVADGYMEDGLLNRRTIHIHD